MVDLGNNMNLDSKDFKKKKKKKELGLTPW